MQFEAEKLAEQKRIEEERLSRGFTIGEDKLLENNSLKENIELAAQLSQFYSLIKGREIELRLDEPGPYTMFLYRDEVFNLLSEEKKNALRDPNQKVFSDDFLLNHIIFADIPSSALASGSEFRASNGRILKILREGTNILVNGQRIETADIKSRNGTIHLLSTPLPL